MTRRSSGTFFPGVETAVVLPTYCCVTCSQRGKTFFIHYYSLSANCILLTPSQGLFHRDGHPVFQEGMVLASHNVTPTIKNRLRTPHLVTIEFVLDNLWDIGSAGQMLFLSLAPNYIGSNRQNIHHECIQFNLKNGRAIKNQLVSVLKRLQKLQQKYLTPLCSILVTTSSPHLPPEIPTYIPTRKCTTFKRGKISP